MEDTQRLNEFSELNDSIALDIKQIKHPVCKQILLIVVPEERKLKIFLANKSIAND